MKDELFDHLKLKLSETEIPGPDQGWLHMQALLEENAPAKRRSFSACMVRGGGFPGFGGRGMGDDSLFG